MSNKSIESEADVPLLAYLWDEYKYRHSLCWAAVYKVSAAVIVVSVLPYVQRDLSFVLGYRILIPPIVGTLLAVFGFLVVHNELQVFAQSKIAHHDLRKRLVLPLLTESERYVQERITLHNFRNTHFFRYVYFLMVMLFALSLANTLFLALTWIPYVQAHPLPPR